jgi:hypothetical protein
MASKRLHRPHNAIKNQRLTRKSLRHRARFQWRHTAVDAPVPALRPGVFVMRFEVFHHSRAKLRGAQ